ncbi:hypothetical protein Q5752_003470 [Cryptotrichosporon argae]
MSSSMLTRRMAAAASDASRPRKVVLVGAGFLGSYIAKALVADPRNRVLLVSRHPEKLYAALRPLGAQILAPHAADITRQDTLAPALEGADAVVSLVGLLAAPEARMVAVQQEGAGNVARAAREAGVKRTVLMSAIGADVNGATAYWRTKARAEEAFLENNSEATIIRPSIVFGPGDSFFNRFATLAKFLPFLPVFGGGAVRFQPVYAGDVARAVEVACRDDPETLRYTGGKIIEAGGPGVLTYREIMQLVLRHTGLEGRRAVVSLPYWLGMLQAWFLEKLPESILTLTRDQVKQLKVDNIVSPTPPLNATPFAQLLAAFPPSLPSSAPSATGLASVHDVLPTYLGSRRDAVNGKRTGGRVGGGFEEVRRLTEEAERRKRA